MAFRTTAKTIPAQKRRRVGYGILGTPESYIALLVIGALALPGLATDLWGENAEEVVRQTFGRLARWLHERLTG